LQAIGSHYTDLVVAVVFEPGIVWMFFMYGLVGIAQNEIKGALY